MGNVIWIFIFVIWIFICIFKSQIFDNISRCLNYFFF